jgi:hypothetical protein
LHKDTCEFGFNACNEQCTFRFGAGIRFTYGSAQGCGGRVQVNGGETKTIQSLDADRDGNYEKDLNCQWLFTGADGKNLRLTFNTFDVESAANDTYRNCFDYVEVQKYTFLPAVKMRKSFHYISRMKETETYHTYFYLIYLVQGKFPPLLYHERKRPFLHKM